MRPFVLSPNFCLLVSPATSTSRDIDSGGTNKCKDDVDDNADCDDKWYGGDDDIVGRNTFWGFTSAQKCRDYW